MSIYKRNVENLDPKRGDKFTLKRETITPLFVPTFPQETRRDIFDTVLGWFADERDKPTPHLKDPLADAFAQSIISGQITAVEKYIDKCDQARDNRIGKNKTKGNARQPSSTKVNGGVQYNDNDNDNGNDNINHCQVSLSGEGSPQGVKSPAAPLPSIEEAKQWLEVHAPQCTSNSELYNDDERRTPKGSWPHKYLQVDALEAAEMIADEKLPLLPPMFLKKLQDKIETGDDEIKIGGFMATRDEVFKRVMLHAYCEAIPDEDDQDEQNETACRIFKAVKDCATMLDVILASGNDTTEDY